MRISDWSSDVCSSDLARGGKELTRRVQSTLATQLAEYVVVYSPIQMAADLPENYEARPDAFRFIRDVPTARELSKTLQVAIGDYVVVARLALGVGHWYLGAIGDAESSASRQPLYFLTPRQPFEGPNNAAAPGAASRPHP